MWKIIKDMFECRLLLKCVNSIMRLIFNEIIVEKRDLYIPWTVHGT